MKRRNFYFVRREVTYIHLGVTHVNWALRRHGHGRDGKYEAWFHSRDLAKRVAALLNKADAALKEMP
jgi:hypothetical protein